MRGRREDKVAAEFPRGAAAISPTPNSARSPLIS